MWEKTEGFQGNGIKLKTCTIFLQPGSVTVGEFSFSPRIEVSLTIGCDSAEHFVIEGCVIKLALLEILRGDKTYLVFEESDEGRYREVRCNESRKDDDLDGR